MFHKPVRRSLVDVAYDTIIEAIVDQRIAPGTRLNIDSLARQLEISNTPIREALSRAVVTGLVRQQGNRGYIVSQPLTLKQYHDLFEARHLLEVESLRVTTVGQDALARLREIALDIGKLDYGTTYRAFKALLDADEAFHRRLIEESGNKFLIEAWKNLHFYLHVSRLHTNERVFTGDDFHRSISDHLQISEYLRQGNQEQAVRMLSAHIKNSEKRVIRFSD